MLQGVGTSASHACWVGCEGVIICRQVQTASALLGGGGGGGGVLPRLPQTAALQLGSLVRQPGAGGLQHLGASLLSFCRLQHLGTNLL